MINICYSIYDPKDKYSKITGTSMLSLLENTKEDITFHLLHDNTLLQKNKNKFKIMIEKYNRKIYFYNMDDMNIINMDYIKKLGESIKFSPATFYRLNIANILPDNINKVIYLDSDTIINLDINDLWKIDIFENEIAAVTDFEMNNHKQRLPIILMGKCSSNDYFNAGVMVMNLKKIREYHPNLFNECIEIIKNNPQFKLYDQDALNYKFAKKFYHLPPYFNVSIYKELIKNNFCNSIYHYLRSLSNLNKGKFVQLYRKYYKKTPWYDI